MLFHWFGSTPEHVYFLGPNFSPEGKKIRNQLYFGKSLQESQFQWVIPHRCDAHLVLRITSRTTFCYEARPVGVIGNTNVAYS